MELVNLGHSTSDIPVPSKKVYLQMMINSVEKYIQNLRWKTLFFLNPINRQEKNNFGFKSTKTPPAIPELKPFEDDLIDMMKNIEFSNKTNPFQQKLRAEQRSIKEEPKLIVAADKTTNFYKVDPKEYKELVSKNVQKEYKKEIIQNVQKINKAHKNIVKKLGIQDRVYKTCNRESFVTLKDHKENFRNNPKCRLLNPTKCELGKISQQILSKIVSTVRVKTGYKQWKNVYSVIEWFKNLKNKKNLSFIVFDVVNYYPSITLELLLKAINWAKQYTNISDEEIEIILETKKSLLVMNGEFWTKKGETNFDVAQGSFDGAEGTDLVGLFMLSELEKRRLLAELGLFRDDGLGASSAIPQAGRSHQENNL